MAISERQKYRESQALRDMLNDCPEVETINLFLDDPKMLDLLEVSIDYWFVNRVDRANHHRKRKAANK